VGRAGVTTGIQRGWSPIARQRARKASSIIEVP
jgi:hypothetical protein